ncbi:MAG TPA: FAD-dependent oxidoreductase, partial [Actinomycetota bacterium]|nr:FAD-dependent oxidoreductase [Actinomycetota bacterium]
MPERLVVIGGDAAGMSAASQARKRRGRDRLEIVAFERGHHTSYSACGIPYLVGGVVEEVDALIVRKPEVFREKQQIDVRMRHEVTAIDLDAREVRARDLENERDVVEGFDQLLIATGAKPLRPPIEGSDATGIFGVQVLDDGLAIEQFLETQKPKKAVIVGGGYIGLEMAEALVNRGLEVTLVERDEQPMSTLDPDMGKYVTEALEGLDITVRTGEEVTRFEAENGFVSAVRTEAGRIEAEVVVLGLGARPNTELAESAGVPLGTSGGIKVDRRMQTEVDGVWAAGDCAEKFHLILRKGVAIALGTHANKEGRVAGINLSGGYETFPGVVGTAVTKVCGIEIARTGLTEAEAAESGFEFVTATVDSTTRAGYFPGTMKIKTKMVVERVSGRLLGAQILGQEGAAKRIDVLATALWNRMTVDDMLNMDLGYAPPFAPVWDPVLIAARKAWARVEETIET